MEEKIEEEKKNQKIDGGFNKPLVLLLILVISIGIYYSIGKHLGSSVEHITDDPKVAYMSPVLYGICRDPSREMNLSKTDFDKLFSKGIRKCNEYEDTLNIYKKIALFFPFHNLREHVDFHYDMVVEIKERMIDVKSEQLVFEKAYNEALEKEKECDDLLRNVDFNYNLCLKASDCYEDLKDELYNPDYLSPFNDYLWLLKSEDKKRLDISLQIREKYYKTDNLCFQIQKQQNMKAQEQQNRKIIQNLITGIVGLLI